MNACILPRVVSGLAAAGAAALFTSVAAAQSPTLDQLLERTAAHIRTHVPLLANVVCQEEYVQQRRSPAAERRLLSDFLLVHYPPSGSDQWMVFRDVREVDGSPLAAQQARVMDLFVAPTEEPMPRAIRIAVEGLRYHLPGFAPALVNPLAAIIFLQDEYRPALRIRRGNEDRSMGPGVRIVRIEEAPRTGPRRGGSDPSLPLFGPAGGRGNVWVEESTGRILKAELRLPPYNDLGAVYTTTFRPDERLGIDVPAEMRTDWLSSSSSLRSRVTGVATYARCRRFDVHAGEATIEIPED